MTTTHMERLQIIKRKCIVKFIGTITVTAIKEGALTEAEIGDSH